MNITKPEVLDYFGLSHDPFSRPLGREDYYPNLELRHCESLVRYAIEHSEMVALLGDYGTGKTIQRNNVLAGLGDKVRVIDIMADKEGLRIRDIEDACLHEMGHDRLPRTRGPRRRMLREGWIDIHGRGEQALVVIDEAHRVSGSTLKALKELHEQSRYAWREALFAVLLVGHRQLPARLAWEARDVLGRLEAHNVLYLSPLSPTAAAEYITHRLGAAGGAAIILEPEVLGLIAARATPLEINRIMWLLLSASYMAGERTITMERVREILPDCGLPTQPPRADGAALGQLLDEFSEQSEQGGTDADNTGGRDQGKRAAG